ncbi:MAG: hypothetical protein JWR32_3286 [Mycobacterium sp.]|jgi:hypothetical protein|nr:hypothetical protein [Mycobacterium sp.]
MRAFFVLLIALGVIATLKWWIAVILCAAILPAAIFVAKVCLDHQADIRRKQRAALSARADQRLKWVMQGDPRGLYGQYPPAVL